MATLTSKLVLQLIDNVTAPGRRVATMMKELTGLGRNMSFGPKAVADMRGLTNATREFGRAAAAPAAGLAYLGGRAIYNFQKVGNTIQAVTGITDEQRRSLEDYIQVLNAEFPFTNDQIAQAALELARAGLTFEQMRGSLRDTLTLSLAGDIEMGHAADLATNIMTAMRMPMADAEQSAASLQRIVDTLAFSANKSNTTVAMMGETFKYVAPLAAAVGMEVEQVAGLSMVLANNGIKASEAGVAMRSALVRMIKPTKPMMQALERLNINININDFVQSGRLISASDIIGSLSFDGLDVEPLRKSLDAILSDTALQQSPARLVKSLTETISQGLGSESIIDKKALADTLTEAVTAAGSQVDFLGFMKRLRDLRVPEGEIMRIFDQRQGSRLLSLMTTDLHELVAMVEKESAGSGRRVADAMNAGIVGAWNEFVAGLENMVIAIGNSGILEDVMATLNQLAKWLQELSKSNPQMLKFAAYAILITAALLPLGLALSIVSSGLGVFASALRLAFTLAAGPAIAAFSSLAAVMSGWGSIASGLGFANAFTLFGSILASLPGIAMSALAAVGTAIASITAPVWVAIAAVAALALAIWNYWVPISEFVTGFASVVGGALMGVITTIASAGSLIATAIGKWGMQQVVDIASILGIDEESVRAAVTTVISSFGLMIDSIVSLFAGLPALIGNWISDIFTMNEYSAEATAGFRSAGEQAGAALVAAVKSAVDGLVSWFSGLPGRIAAAIGRIDIGSLFSWGTPPAWVSWLLNGGSSKPSSPATAAIDGARAAGGPVRAGGTYLVGEEGPEIVTFGESGMVHNAMATVRFARHAALASALAIPAAPSYASGEANLRQASSTTTITNTIAPGAIVVNCAPGQSAEAMANAVERMLSHKLNNMMRGSYADGGE